MLSRISWLMQKGILNGLGICITNTLITMTVKRTKPKRNDHIDLDAWNFGEHGSKASDYSQPMTNNIFINHRFCGIYLRPSLIMRTWESHFCATQELIRILRHQTSKFTFKAKIHFAVLIILIISPDHLVLVGAALKLYGEYEPKKKAKVIKVS